MDPEDNHVLEPEQRLDAVATAYLQALEAGDKPERSDWLARYPDLASELADFFADQDKLDRWTAPLRAVVGAARVSDVPTEFPDQTPRPAGSSSPAVEAGNFGDYEILEEIGRGGMGVVYKARQKSLNRLVALKVLRARDLGGESELQRFRNEAEMVAVLDHPGIVPVHEVGSQDGRHYFSMKLIEGGSLANQLERFAAQPRLAAALLASVARAIHHAHQRGILHRDLKPSNILLDQDGRPHVTDFGLAKRVETDCSLTQSGTLVGTPSYMAPEQASGVRGAITTATDVYGLGALLYTLLCARPPFKGETVLGTLEQVKTREPDPPSGSNPKLDRDLETICLKCLEKEPGQRYPSAEALADELERWLRGEPIRARSVGRPRRLWRWCRRNPVVAGLTGTVALLVIGAMVGLSIATAIIWREQEETKTALAEARTNYKLAETQRQRAEANSREAHWALEDILCAFDPERSSRPVSVAELRQWQTERALSFLATSCEDQSEDPSARSQKAGAYVHTGRVYQVLGERDKAQKAFKKALAVYVDLVQDFPDEPRYDYELATALRILAEDRYEAGRLSDANLYYRQAVDAWREAIRKHPTHHNAYLQLAYLLCNWLDPQLRDPRAALRLARTAVELAPNDPHSRLALGFAFYRTGQWNAALDALQKGMQWPEVQRQWGWTHALFILAMTQWRRGRHEEAMQAYRQADRRMARSFRARDILDRAIRAEAAALLGIQQVPTPKAKEEASRKD